MSREVFLCGLIVWSLFQFLPFGAASQIQIDTTHSANALVNNVLKGNGVLVGNVKYTGARHAIAYFEDEAAETGISKGIMLTTGNALMLAGPNRSTFTSWVNGTGGDRQLESIARGKTYDASVLEFDFITAAENLSFYFVFASEEYLEYVDSRYNDVFAFFITGPGHDHTNIAVLPGEKIPITVNSINNKRNTKYYVDNEYINTTDPYLWDARKRQVIINKNYLKDPVLPPYHIEFDGFTRVIQARCTVIPNEVYSIKIAIADVADPILDSGVFLEGGSFSSFGDELVELINPFESEEEITSINEQIEIEEEEIAETEMQQQSETKEEGMVSFEKDIAIAEVANVIEFEFDKFELSEASQNIMWRIKEDLENKPAKKLLIIGHTDSIGTSDYNRWLSFMRSMTTFNWLNDRGIGPERMRISYYGELMPRDSNLTAEGRAKNRRVELFLISTEE